MPLILWAITIILVRFKPFARSAMPRRAMDRARQRKGSKSARASASGHTRG